jgi:CheY-like chemotaxis protein
MARYEYSVVVADDDIWMQRVLSKTLQSYGFKKVFLASNGIEVISKSVEYRPDLIVLDILMPEMSGHLALQVLKAIHLTKDIPVVMVSALSDVENLGKAVKGGTAGFISKPFTRTTVYEKLVDIYGKEKLEMIIKGIPISDADLGYYKESGFRPKDPFADPDDDEIDSLSTITDDDSDSEDLWSDVDTEAEGDSDKKVSKSRLSSHYQEDERTSIESIKEMLLKGK